MDSSDIWLKRPQSSIRTRNVDKELQHIKSLAVVSVLNKSFKESTPSNTIASLDSSTASETTSNRNRARSYSYCHSTRDLKDRNKKSSTSLRDDYFSFHYGDMRHPRTESESQQSLDTEKETPEKRVHELQELYSTTLKSGKLDKLTINAQSEIILAQDRLIHQYSDNIDELEAENRELRENCIHNHVNIEDNSKPNQLLQEEVAYVLTELNQLLSTKATYETYIQSLQAQLVKSDAKIAEMERIGHAMHKECLDQTQFIDTKLHALTQQILDKDKIISKYHHLHDKPLLVTPSKSETRRSLFNESHVIWENNEEMADNPRHSTSTSSRTSSINRHSHINRWKGNLLPPPSPPPSQPLPPIPIDISLSASRHKHPPSSELSNHSNLTLITQRNISTDAFGEPSSDSKISAYSGSDISMTESEYYKEFTDQLQARLSISKEIDDLRVWEPSDYAEIQKKIDSKNWLNDRKHGNLSQKEQIAFWKGMKKKLRK